MSEAIPENIVIKSGDEAGGGLKNCQDECPIECACCADTFTKKARAPVICPNGCGYVACKECVRTYLLNTAEAPHCMNCKAAWNDRFMVANLNSSYVNNDFKKHRKQLLLERQISMLPETMPALARIQRLREYEKFKNIQQEQIKELKRQIRMIEETIGLAYRQAHYNYGVKEEEETSKKFILPCPDPDCRGFLSTAYKCELCSYYACPKCLILTGKERHDETHVCDEELVKTAELIRKTSKPCPKCGERIIKSQGCDQMWCVKCHTAFSWKTGKIDTGTIHNPHFNQYQREVNNGAVVRNPHDVVCGGLNGDWWRVRNILRSLLNTNLEKEEKPCSCSSRQNKFALVGREIDNKPNNWERIFHRNLINKFSELFQFMRHINGYELPNYRQQVRNLDNFEEIRIKYLLKELSKEGMAKEAIKRDKKRRKMIELMHIYELIVAVGNDLVNHLCDFVLNIKSQEKTDPIHVLLCNELTHKFNEYDNFIDYVNNQFKMISVTYSQNVIQIEKNKYDTFTKRFTLRDIETFA